MAKKRRKTPEVLWRLFRHRARTLYATVTSLLPSAPPPNLLRRGDPSAYRDLLNHWFVAVDFDQSPPVIRSQPESHWPQNQIVARTIEMMMSEDSADSNVLCSSYDKFKQSSPFMEILSGPDWCLLLERVGEEIMFFLLKHTSIFLPVARFKYQQVAGPPVSKTCFEMLNGKFESRPNPSDPKKKREREDILSPTRKRQEVTSSLDIDGAASSFACVPCCTDENFTRLLSSDHKDKHCQMPEAAKDKIENVMVNCKDDFGQCVVQNSNQTSEMVMKRRRPFSWQRNRKRRQLSCQETASEVTFKLSTFQKNLSLENAKSDNIKCTLEKQIQQKVSKGGQINRKELFYNMNCSSSAFPGKHILNTLRPNSSGARILLKSIFGFSDEVISSNAIPCFQFSGFSLSHSASACLYISLSKWLKTIIRRAQNCQHLRLLNKHCGVPTPDQNDGRGFDDNGPEAIKSYCQKTQVVSFVWAVCRSIVPQELLGTETNWRRLRKNIFKFVRLRRYEDFSLKQCMHQVKTSAFPFLDTANESINPIMKQRLLESWIYWIFSYLVLPLLQANFYVTETERGRNDVFYYRKEVWEKVKKRAVADLKDKSYVCLDNGTAMDIVKSRRFGFSKLRLLPKENGTRLLANLKAPSMLKQDFFPRREISGISRRACTVNKKADFRHFKSVNSVLRDAHAVLKGIYLKEPDRLGSSVFDYNDVYRRLCSFKAGLSGGSSGIPAVYIIASDVSKAFDSVDQDKLLSVIGDVIGQENYTLKHFSQILCTEKSLWVQEKLVLCDQNGNGNSSVTPFNPFQPSHSILVNQDCLKSVNRRELLINLNEHVKRNVLQLDTKLYLQRVGISQGSILSPLLCSLYYGDMDNKVIFPFLEKVTRHSMNDITRNPVSEDVSRAQITNIDVSYMLLRFIDDFLFISTSKQQAENFFYRLSRGFRDYNCYMNVDKFCVNFDIQDLSEVPSKRLCLGKDGASFLRWSGLLINSRTLEVQGDYTKYFNIHLSSSLTIKWQSKPGRSLAAKLCGFMRPKCHPIFFDSNINSDSVVRLNIFQAFLLCAMKFHCYYRELSYICKFRSTSYLRFIKKCFRYMHFMINKRMRSTSLGSKTCPILRLDDGEVEWLGLNAFTQVLKRKQSRHKALLSLLMSELSMHNLSRKRSTDLDFAIDASHSSILWQIRY